MRVLIVNKSFVIVHVSPELIALLQAEQRQCIGKHLADVFEINSYLLSSLQTSCKRVGYTLPVRYGSIADYFLTVTEENNFGTTFLVSRSVLMEDHEQLAEHFGFFEEALLLSFFGVWYTDLSNRKIYFSRSIKQLLNITEQGLVSWEMLEQLLLPCDRVRLQQLLFKSLKINQTIVTDFKVVNHLREFWLEIAATAISKNGQTVYLGTMRDCSKEKLAVRSLHDAYTSRSMALDAGNIGTWRAIKINHRWEWYWDDIANNLFEMRQQDMGNLAQLLTRVHPDDTAKLFNTLDSNLTIGTEFQETFRALLPSGKQIYVLCRGVVAEQQLDQLPRIDGVVIDQTSIFEVKNALRDSNAKLEAMVNKRTKELQSALQQTMKVSESKSDFLSMMSHELRTPMNAIIGSLELLNDNQSRSLEEVELIETAFQSAKNLVLILNDILDLNKIESGKLDLEYLDFNLSSLIHSVVSVFTTAAVKNNIIFKVIESIDIPVMINGDEARLRQIVFNLLSNAIKFTSQVERQGEVELHVSVNQQASPLQELKITVKDNGIGIDKQVQKKLFTPFMQAEKSTTRKYGGTGLGLAISGELLELMGGRVEVRSQLNQGSEFNVFIPTWKVEAQQEKLAYSVALIEFKPDQITQQVKDKLLNLGIKIVDHQQADILLYRLKYRQLLADLPHYTQMTFYCYSQTDGFMDLSCFKSIPFLDLDKLTNAKLIHLFTRALRPLAKAQVTSDAEVKKEVDEESILLIEDNPFNQKLIVKQLAKLGFKCTLASNGVEGLSLFKQQTFKLVLTDCHMPEMDGYTLAMRIREFETKSNRQRTPLIAVTGAAMAGDRQLCIDSGMDDFISKPIELKKLQTMLSKWEPNDRTTADK